ncbi:MAG: ATP-binding protein [Deltaproteobacteria bacterium]|nr:ATP-binding protein [Deltaproteobacteria bacterium]
MVPSGDSPVSVWSSLRTEIVLKVIVLTVTTVLLVSVVAFKILELEVFRQRLDAARQVIVTLHHELTNRDPMGGASQAENLAEARRITTQLLRAGNLQSLYLVDPAGRVIAHSDPERLKEFARDPLVARALETGATVTTLRDSPAWFLGMLTNLTVDEDVQIAMPLATPSGETIVGVAVVPLGDVKRSVTQSLKVLIAFIALDAFIVVIFGSWFLSRALVRPLDHLSSAANAIAGGNLRQKVGAGKRNEIGALGRAFNLMTDRLRESSDRIDEQIERLQEANAELARAQADLIRSEKLASVGRLAAGVAHEVGNPLSSILGLTDILLKGGGTGFELPDEAREHAAQIRNETERIHRIIRRLLDFSRPSQAEILEVSVNDVVQETLALTEPMADLWEVRVRLDLDRSAPKAMTDTALLQQALMNLIVNAAQAMPDGGTLSISSRAIVFEGAERALARRADDPPAADYGVRRRSGSGLRPGDAAVELVVADTGHGIPPELLPHVFDPFVTTKEPGRGTGLGLAVVHSIVDMLQGKVRVKSDAGKGAVFTLMLPGVRETS